MQATRVSSLSTTATPPSQRQDVPFLDLKAQNRSIWNELTDSLEAVATNAQFILGPAVERFENQFAKYIGTKYCVGLNNGTSALHLALLACGVGPGDEPCRRRRRTTTLIRMVRTSTIRLAIS